MFSQSECIVEFKRILLENCFVLSFTEEPNTITQEQSLVVRDLEKYLNNDREKAKKLIEGLKKLCSKQKYFKKALLPTILEKENMDMRVEQESLIRNLLKVNILQNEIVEFILDAIVQTVSTEEEPSWLRLLLSQLKYLPNINNGEELTTKLLDTIEICSLPMQLEILDILPEILPDNRYNQAAKQLITFLNTKDSPTTAIIDCLSALNLDEDVKKDVQDVILTRILPSRVQNFPVLMEFLLETSKGADSGLINKIRDALDSVMSCSKQSPEKDTSKLLVFNKLKRFVITRKQFVQDVLDTIKSTNEHKPIDILLLILLHSAAKNKKRIIELNFKKKIKENEFKFDLFEKLLKSYFSQQIFKDQFNSILEIGCSLIRTSGELSIRLFTKNLFKSLFAFKYTEGIYRREILDNLLILAGDNDKSYVEQVLKILLLLVKKDVEKFKQHSVIMMRLLEKMDSFDLDAIKMVFEILCSITCGDDRDESMLSLRDEIHMIIRKQLSSSKKNIKFRGIVGAVVMANHIATTNEEQNDSIQSDDITIDKLPPGKSQNAAKLIEMTNNRIEGCYESMGLFYDELALMLRDSEHLESNFQNWLCEIIQQDFMDTFIVTDFENFEYNDITYSPQFCLNAEEDPDIPVLINIGSMTVKPMQSGNSSVLLLASHFRLLRLLIHKKHNGDMSSIDALLGSAILLPEFEDVEDLDHNQLKEIADCLFHCINWFRELISAFIFHKPIRSKLIQRLEQLIELERKFDSLISRTPDHLLPQSYFNSLSQNKQVISIENKRKQPPTKKFKSKAIIHDETATSTVALTGRERKKSTISTMKEKNIQFREIDTDFYRLFKMKLKLNSDKSSDLKLSTFAFMLNDLVKKLNVILMKKKTSTPLNAIKPRDLIYDSIKLLPNLHKNFLVVRNKIKENLDENESSETQELKICFTHVLECYNLIFSWPELHEAKNLEVSREALEALRIEESRVNSVSFLATELINFFGECVNECFLITQGVFLVKFLKNLDSFAANNKRKKSTNEICKNLLEKRWLNEKGVLDSGKNYTSGINFLVNSYLESMKIEDLEELIANVLLECENLKTKDDCLTILQSIDYKNFYIFYQGLCIALYNGVKTKIRNLTHNGHLELWSKTTDSMSNLMNIARSMRNNSQFSVFLKQSIAILRIFLSHGIPTFEKIFKSHTEKIVHILRTLQTSTRFLHYLCCDSKMKKSISLVAHIPNFRLLLDQLVYKVKALLFANNCSEAFYMGNLKNKDIEGNTQISEQMDESDEENEGDELPEDDDSDETVLNPDDCRGDKSDSEVFD